MRLWGSTFGKSLQRACVAGVMVSAVLALLAGGTGQVLAANFYVGGDGASDRNPGTETQPFATIQKASGLAAAGVDIRMLGPMPTPAVAYLTRTLHASAGIVISASHNPHEDNGIKFFSAEGCKLPDEVEAAVLPILRQPVEEAAQGLF